MNICQIQKGKHGRSVNSIPQGLARLRKIVHFEACADRCLSEGIRTLKLLLAIVVATSLAYWISRSSTKPGLFWTALAINFAASASPCIHTSVRAIKCKIKQKKQKQTNNRSKTDRMQVKRGRGHREETRPER